MSAKKPSVAAIMRGGYLTEYTRRPVDPMSACNLCGEEASWLEAYREHDEQDHPIPGNDRILFIGYEHEQCEQRMIAHPRLYEEDTGEPGAFPRLCGDCAYRDGLRCTHRDLKANGGTAGLRVELEGGGLIMCGKELGFETATGT